MFSAEIGGQRKPALEKAGGRSYRIRRDRCDDKAPIFFRQLDFFAGLESELPSQLPGNQHLALCRDLYDSHKYGSVL